MLMMQAFAPGFQMLPSAACLPGAMPLQQMLGLKLMHWSISAESLPGQHAKTALVAVYPP